MGGRFVTLCKNQGAVREEALHIMPSPILPAPSLRIRHLTEALLSASIALITRDHTDNRQAQRFFGRLGMP